MNYSILSKQWTAQLAQLIHVIPNSFSDSLILVPVWIKIINQSLSQGSILQNWKEAITLPIQTNHKLGTELTNCSPINNLTFFTKLIENIILNQLWDHFRINKLTPSYQSTYRANHSPETAIPNICDNILNSMENNINTTMVALDLSAALHTVNHKIPFEVLNKYFGIQGIALKWIKSYLTNRQFHVQIEDQFSNFKTIDFLVPQGSILGPIFLTCYASTLQELFTNHSSLSGYEDDHSFTKVFKPIDHKILTELELDIKYISDWMHQNHLKMNNGKTEFITFWTRPCLKNQDLPEIIVGDDVAKGLDTIKFLGLISDKELKMTRFIAAKARTTHFNIEKIKRIRKYLTEDETKMVMHSIVLPPRLW